MLKGSSLNRLYREIPMAETMTTKTPIAGPLDPTVSARILDEGYGPGAWHGPDLRAALSDLTPERAFWRPGVGRHNVAEIAVHHAWCVRSAISQLGGAVGEPFPFEGADWFDVSNESRISWTDIATLVETQHGQLATTLTDIASGRLHSPMAEADRFDLVLGVTCHAVYHAGQVQLIKVLAAAQ
jgi:hypothetical protein